MSKRRWIICLAINAIAIFCLSMINHYLSSWGISIFLAGLWLSCPALLLHFRQGLLCIACTALLIDSKSPLPFGFHLFAMLALYGIIRLVRNRLPRFSSSSWVYVSHTMNILMTILITITVAFKLSSYAISYYSLIGNIVFSSIVLAIINHFYFELNKKAMLLLGINIDEEERELI